jgi:hypothetical protein
MGGKVVTPALRQFLADWLAWAEAGAPEHPNFGRSNGLCVLAHYARGEILHDLRKQLRASFEETPYPFGGSREFSQRAFDRTQHLNPARLAWVRQQLGVGG